MKVVKRFFERVKLRDFLTTFYTLNVNVLTWKAFEV